MFWRTALITPSGTPNSTEKTSASTRELRRDRDARQDLVDGRLLRHVGVAQIAARQAADPADVLDDDRLVEAELLLDLLLAAGLTKPAESKMMSVMLPGTSRSMTKIRIDMPTSVTQHQEQSADEIGSHSAALPIACAPVRALLVEPHVLVAPVVVNAVVVQHEALHVRLPAGGAAVVDG